MRAPFGAGPRLALHCAVAYRALLSALATRAKFRELVHALMQRIGDELAHLLHREEGIDLGLL